MRRSRARSRSRRWGVYRSPTPAPSPRIQHTVTDAPLPPPPAPRGLEGEDSLLDRNPGSAASLLGLLILRILVSEASPSLILIRSLLPPDYGFTTI